MPSMPLTACAGAEAQQTKGGQHGQSEWGGEAKSAEEITYARRYQNYATWYFTAKLSAAVVTRPTPSTKGLPLSRFDNIWPIMERPA